MPSFSLYKVILGQSNTLSLTTLPDFCFVANSPVAKENANEIMKIVFNSDMIKLIAFQGYKGTLPCKQLFKTSSRENNNSAECIQNPER